MHLRRGLVEDAGFRWDEVGAAGRLPEESWNYALVFSDPTVDGRTIVVLDLEGNEGWLAVQGRPGRAALGRLGRGLAEWVAATVPSVGTPESR